MKKAILAVILLTVLTAGIAWFAIPKPSEGVYSNEAEGFRGVTIILDRDGKGWMAGLPFEWKYSRWDKEVTITLMARHGASGETMKLRYLSNDELEVINSSGKVSTTIHKLDRDIPPRLSELLEKYDGTPESVGLQ